MFVEAGFELQALKANTRLKEKYSLFIKSSPGWSLVIKGSVEDQLMMGGNCKRH